MSSSVYSAWVWSPEHQRHYCYRYVNGQIEYQWSGLATAQAQAAATTSIPQTPQGTSAVPRTVPTIPSAAASSPGATSSRTNTSSGKRPQPKKETPIVQEEKDDDEEDENESDEEDDDDDDDEGSGAREGRPALQVSSQAYRPVATTTTQPGRSHSYQYGAPQPNSYQYGGAQSTAATYASSANTPYVAPASAPTSPQYTFQRPHTGASQTAVPQKRQNSSNGGGPNHRHIKSTAEGTESKEESLDPRYKRVSLRHTSQFFCRGRVFKMLWTEPAGVTPGKTRGSTHFSLIRFNETAYSEIRRFIVISNKGKYSQCIPIQTYRGQGARKQGIIVNDHALIYTGAENDEQPQLLPGERITKQPLRVEPTGQETLEPASRVNFGKVYTVEHNVKVLDVGVVAPQHIYLLINYFTDAVTSV